MRLFVAVDPGERVRTHLATCLDTWRRMWDLSWVRSQNLHITLRFLGEQPVEVDLGLQHFGHLAQRFAAFRLHLHADELKVVILPFLKWYGFLGWYLHQLAAQFLGPVPVVAAAQF